MGALLGLLLGVGALLVYLAISSRGLPVVQSPPQTRAVRPSRSERMTERLAAADLHGVRPGTVTATAVGLAVVTGGLVLAVTRTYPVALLAAAAAGWLPFVFVRRRGDRRLEELRGLWPDAVDNLASSIRAGLSLPEALAQLGVRGPVPLRAAFLAFGADYRATGRFTDCLDALKTRLADPVADRIVEALRLAREVGGNDLGKLLRTLSSFLRQDAYTRSELIAKQSWTVNAARLAVAAPWLVLALLALQPDIIQEFNSRAGVIVLLIGLGLSVFAYRLMVRIGRLPVELRVLR